MEETEECIVWDESFRPNEGRYLFPLPKTTARYIERSLRPVWHRYRDHSYSPPGVTPCAFLDALEGWHMVFDAMLPILQDVGIGKPEDISTKLFGLHATLTAMGDDLIDLIRFGDATLPYDPWTINAVQKAMREYPEIFQEESSEEEFAAALPVPPEDDQPMQ